jgi:hypothetical protein
MRFEWLKTTVFSSAYRFLTMKSNRLRFLAWDLLIGV